MVLGVPVDLCLFGAFLVRGTQRFMKEQKELEYTYSFDLPACTLVVKTKNP
jgi:hypothetical protein